MTLDLDMAMLTELAEAIRTHFGPFIQGYDEQQAREFVAAVISFMQWLGDDEDA